jgi:hypothetical protein
MNEPIFVRRLAARAAALVAFAVIAVTVAFAQSPPPNPPENPTTGAGNLTGVSFLSSREFMLTLGLIIFGLIVLGLEYALVRNRVGDKIEDLTKFFIVTLIIIGTLVLIGAGLKSADVAPVIGLFGTIAGYVLGRNERSPNGAQPKDGGGAH